VSSKPTQAALLADIREPMLARTAALDGAAVLAQTADWLAAGRLDACWAREHAMPWFSRRVREVSTGDGIPPKRPEMLPR
jgi:hypothetical protein